MSRTKAIRQARSEISKPYHTIPGTYGLSTKAYGDRPTQTTVGSYRDAVEARAAWIAERIATLMAEG